MQTPTLSERCPPTWRSFNTPSKHLAVLVLSLVIVGCASTSVFKRYTTQASQYKQAMLSFDIKKADRTLKGFEKKTDSQDKILYLSEAGRVQQFYNEYEASKATFEKSIAAYIAEEEKAKLSLSKGGAYGASMLTNDNAIPYRGYGFERVFTHHLQAFNYMGLNDLQGAAVELRRASDEQRFQELAHEKEIDQAKTKARKENVQMPDLSKQPELAGMDSIAANLKSSFQNAYTFYTSAVFFEAMGDVDRAHIDFKKAYELNPSLKALQEDVQRTQVGAIKSPNDAKQTVLVILYEDGFIPQRQSFELTVPDFLHNNYLSIAFPFYSQSNWYQPSTLNIYQQGLRIGQTQLIADFGAMAVKALKEKIPGFILRQILRARIKQESQKALARQNPLLGLAASIFNIVSEQADVRNWLTLPNNAQVKRLSIDANTKNLELGIKGMKKSVNIELKQGRTSLLRVYNLNNRLKTQLYQL